MNFANVTYLFRVVTNGFPQSVKEMIHDVVTLHAMYQHTMWQFMNRSIQPSDLYTLTPVFNTRVKMLHLKCNLAFTTSCMYMYAYTEIMLICRDMHGGGGGGGGGGYTARHMEQN